MGVQGILTEGRVKGMLYHQNDPDSGSGEHGFYARAWVEAYTGGEPGADAQAVQAGIRAPLRCGHHHGAALCSQGDIQPEANEEATKVEPGRCTRLRLGNGGDRWCFHEDCAQLKAKLLDPMQAYMNATDK